jgi:hypothetical protein
MYKSAVANAPCIACPLEHSTTVNLGSTNVLECMCMEGHFLWDRNGERTCEPCTKTGARAGTNCTASGIPLEQLPVSSGYFRLTDVSQVVRKCKISGTCLGGTQPSGQCKDGMTGPYCAVCKDGWWGSDPQKDRACTRCEGSPESGIYTLAGILGAFCGFVLLSLVTGAWRTVLRFFMALDLNVAIVRGAKKVKINATGRRRSSLLRKSGSGPIGRFFNWFFRKLMYYRGYIKKQQVGSAPSS